MGAGGGERGSFGALLRWHRLAAALSQEELAERAGLSRRGISDLERGARRAPYPATVRRLADALGLPPAERGALLGVARLARGGTPAPPSARPGAGLPVPLTSLVGREREVDELSGLLGTARLLTLSGPGGVGKTRLALEVARAAGGRYADGAVLVELGPLADPVHVPQAVAAALGVREEPPEPLERTLAEALRARHLLLVLDNCEHVVAASAALVAGLLGAGAGLRVLATSREPLALPGEVLWRVPALAVPASSAGDDPAGLEKAAAVRLFVERAAAAQPGFRLSPGNAPAVAEVCRRLDGLPLALELAAARLPALGPEGVAQRLDDRFRLLAHGARTAPARQRTLSAAIDWSYALLTERERAVFARLSVFARGCTLEAAEAVCAGPGGPERIALEEVLDLVASLVAKSLVTVQPGGPAGSGADGSLRYRLLETLRAYAGDRLAERDDLAASRERHAVYFLALAQRAEPALRSSGQAAWLGRLEQEHDDLRGALTWSLEQGRAALALGLGAALTRFWLVRGHLGEGYTWLERALALPDAPAERGAHASALTGAGILAWHRGAYERAEAHLRQALAVATRAPVDGRRAAAALYELAKVAISRGELPAARGLAEQALDRWRAAGDAWGEAVALNLLGEAAREEGDLPAARGLYEESRRLFESVEDQRGVAITGHNLGIVYAEQGEYRRAIAVHQGLLPLKRELGDREGLVCTLLNLAWLAWVTGERERALRLCGAAEAGRMAIGAVLPTYERGLYARTMDLAGAALGAGRCAALEALGRVLALDAAVAEGLRVGDAPAGTPAAPGGGPGQ